MRAWWPSFKVTISNQMKPGLLSLIWAQLLSKKRYCKVTSNSKKSSFRAFQLCRAGETGGQENTYLTLKNLIHSTCLLHINFRYTLQTFFYCSKVSTYSPRRPPEFEDSVESQLFSEFNFDLLPRSGVDLRTFILTMIFDLILLGVKFLLGLDGSSSAFRMSLVVELKPKQTAKRLLI